LLKFKKEKKRNARVKTLSQNFRINKWIIREKRICPMGQARPKLRNSSKINYQQYKINNNLYFFCLPQRSNDDEDEFKSGFESELAAFDDEIEGNLNEHTEIGKIYNQSSY